MEQARLDRPDGAWKDGGDLVEAVADAVDQFDDHSLVGAQVLEGPVQQVAQFSILVRVHAALEFREDGVVDRLVTLAAQCLEPAAIGNPHQPGRDACIAAEVACLPPGDPETVVDDFRSEEHTSELQSLMRISYAVFCLKKKKKIDLYSTTTNFY